MKLPVIFYITFTTSFIFCEYVDAENENTINKISSSDIKLISDPRCPKIKKICGDLESDNDLNVIECLQSAAYNDIKTIKRDCQEVIWNHTDQLIEDANVVKTLKEACTGELTNSNCKPEPGNSGQYLACILDLREDMKNEVCLRQISKLESVAFFDLRWVTQFLQACSDDAVRLECNSLETNKEIVYKGEFLGCLQKKIKDLGPKCKKQVLKLSEMQADNIKFDYEMYMACAADRLRYCLEYQPGSGLVFKCLMQHKTDKLSDKCSKELTKRQKLIVQDYKINKGLMKACREDIRRSRCRKQSTDDRTLRLAQVLGCLERYVRNGSRVSSDCEGEMMDQRRALMEDYSLSLEILEGCKLDIQRLCEPVNGRTIHCLMEHAHGKKDRNKISDQCKRALETLLKETDAGEDWRADPVLRDACNEVVQRACKDVRGGDARVMSCLMDNLGSNVMQADCENALVQIQYFVARDFRLDPKLYRNCKKEATELCHAPSDDWDAAGPDNAPLVLPCLYRYAYHPDKEIRLSVVCLEQVRRVMRQRAVRVDLQPEIEERCIDDLSMFCTDKVKHREETTCLQQHLHELKEQCKQAVTNLTEDQAQHAELNPEIAKFCVNVAIKYCSNIDRIDNGNLLECLISHKNEPDVRTSVDGLKCRAAVEHFQLISLKNYRFTYKFKVACKSVVARYCSTSSTKPEVISCLSEIVRNDTLTENRNRIPKECRQQLRAQLLQQRENVDFDSALSEACRSDIREKCASVPHGAGRVLECLRESPKLSAKCRAHIFKIDSQDMQDNGIDYGLVTMCSSAIRQYCEGETPAHVLDCLEMHKDEPTIDMKCRHVLLHRLMERSKDYRFDPRLHAACKGEINMFCSHLLTQQKPDQMLDGAMTECLKDQFRLGKLSAPCETRITEILRLQALDYRLNPLLYKMCELEIKIICKQTSTAVPDDGHTEECLKNAFLNRHNMSPECRNEVAHLIEESKADIHVDPLLQRACTNDLLLYCGHVKQGGGKLLKCLQVIMTETDKPMQHECREMLTKRMEMFRNAALIAAVPDNIGQLYAQVATSPAKRYFAIIGITTVGLIFFAGLFCGRVTRRARVSKNK